MGPRTTIRLLQWELAAQVERAEKAESDLAALRKRIEEAPQGVVQTIPDYIGGPTRSYIVQESESIIETRSLVGHRVRLLVEKEP